MLLYNMKYCISNICIILSPYNPSILTAIQTTHIYAIPQRASARGACCTCVSAARTPPTALSRATSSPHQPLTHQTVRRPVWLWPMQQWPVYVAMAPCDTGQWLPSGYLLWPRHTIVMAYVVMAYKVIAQRVPAVAVAYYSYDLCSYGP